MEKKTVYDFTVADMRKQPVSLRIYSGKVMLIVNTATGCGFTPQYEGLQELYRKYRDKGFVVLDFPCNQFGHQAPESEKEIADFCDLNYHVTFPQFAKIKVNGEDADPLYVWMKKQKKGLLGSTTIKWNFTKFLIDREGNVVQRFSPAETPEQIEKHIKALL
ncbi:MAG: glutathione peroxidase [Bacteroidales bacterium]|nr:glutathione peroxidase [Bacteroidales bacterium]